MATTPFDAALVASLKEQLQSGKLAVLKQWVDNPQFFCCISGNTVGVAKDPVPVLTVPDRVVCIGDNVTVDFSLSWSPTDTLAGQPYTIHWGDGGSVNGNFPNPRNPAAENEMYVGGYASVGYYEITIDVQDSLGATASAMLQVYARDCTQPANSLPWPLEPEPWQRPHYVFEVDGAIVGGDTEVWYTLNLSAANPAWNACANGPYPGVEIHDIMLELLLDDTTEYIYVADFDGIYQHDMPPDWGNWTTLATADQMVAAAGVGDIAQRTNQCQRLAIAMASDGRQYCSWQSAPTFPFTHDYKCGVAFTEDGWATITRSVVVETIVYNGAATQWLEAGGVDISQYDSGQSVWFSVASCTELGVTESAKLYKSINFGLTWTKIDELSGITAPYNTDVWIPPSGLGNTYFWGCYEEIRKNGVQALNLSGLSYTSTFRMCGPLDTDTITTFIVGDQLHEYQGLGDNYLIPDLPSGSAYGLLVLDRDGSKWASEILWAGGGANQYVKINDDGAGQADKDLNWTDAYPHAVARPEKREYDT